MSALELSNVTKRFAGRAAVADLSLAIGEGEVVALLGPNGAGKSTIIELAAGLRRPDNGRVELNGRDPSDHRARQELGLMSQETDFPDMLRVDETVAFVGAHRRRTSPTNRAANVAALESMGIAHLARRTTGSLSGGERRRLAAALAFVGAPRVVLLDEPGVGLDAESITRLIRLIRAHAASGGCVVIATHQLAEADAVATRVAVAVDGQLVCDDDLTVVRSRWGRYRIAYTRDAEVLGGRERVVITTDDPATAIANLFADGAHLDDLEVRAVRLEDVIDQLVA